MPTQHEWVVREREEARARWVRVGKHAINAGVPVERVQAIREQGELIAQAAVKVLRESAE
jgi:hypothetical protein